MCCERRGICWAPLRPTAAHRHTRHWCSRPRTCTTWGVGVLVVRGEAKSQQPHLVVYTWREDIVWPCTWTCILSRDVRKIDHHTNWHDGFSGPSACAGAGSIVSRALGSSNCSALRSSWRLNRLHVLFHILGHACFATACTLVSGDHASSESHAKPPSEKYCKTSRFDA